jgi:tetratricopeptide (TPR) repeat protein
MRGERLRGVFVGLVRRVGVVALAATLAACVSTNPPPVAVPGAPRYPDYPVPDVPSTLTAPPDVRLQHDQAWQRLQSGDLPGAAREFQAVVTRMPGFYPSEAGLGFALLAQRQYEPAAAHFSAAAGWNDRYLPAWEGLAAAQLAAGNEAAAMVSLEKALAIDPSREASRNRLALLHLKQVQTLLDTGRAARADGRWMDASAAFERALALSPSSGAILRELAFVETARGALDAAEAHARRAIELDAADAVAYATLGEVLEARGRYVDAAEAFASAARIDPRPAWKERSTTLRDRADLMAIPSELRTLASAATVTRAQTAALVGIRLAGVIGQAPRRVTDVATDVQGHWAAPWILAVTQAGVLEVFPNHTFQPQGILRRSDLAQVVAQMLGLVASRRPADVASWKAGRPAFVDLPATNVYYPAAALAVSAGAMTVADGHRFGPLLNATGADVLAAISRLEQIAGR